MSATHDDVSSTPVAFRLRWDVFLSFRGTDTRDSFTKNLYDSLLLHGVRVFRDDGGLHYGDEIASCLLEAIDDSAASIVIFSPNYASSHWCLEELAKILDCGRLIIPVFYGVDPSDVRKQKGPFEKAFTILTTQKDRFEEEKVLRWRKAMYKVGGLDGLVFNNYNSEDANYLIQNLVQDILKELSNTPVYVAEFTVGLENRVEELMKLIDVTKSSSLKILGLHGTGGIGKTTLAKALYNKLVSHFEHRSFISNVRENSSNDGLISLQKKLIGDLSPGTVIAPEDVNGGVAAMEEIVRRNRVLIVLDDVDDVSQLNLLIGNGEWFCEGSLVVITTRDRGVLLVGNQVELYEVKELNPSDSLKLFSYHALRRKEPTDKFLDLSTQIVLLTGGLPLALEVFGSFLFDKRTIEQWNDAVQKLKIIRPRHLQDVLKISFDGLDEQQKCVFLDISCLFVNMEMKREDVIDVLRGCGIRAETEVSILTAKSLIKLTNDNTLWMHDQVRDMGRQIVEQENLRDPGMRSRLWDRDEIMNLLKAKKGTRNIQGIVLDFKRKRLVRDRDGDEISWDYFRQKPSFTSAILYMKERYKRHVQDREEKKNQVILHTEQFESMVNLRLLQINYLRLEGKFKYLPAELKWLQWKECPLKSIPGDYCPRELAVLDLSHSDIEMVWGRNTKVAEKLIVMNLSDCYKLAAIPDLSGCQSLQKLVLKNCIGLTKIHESVMDLTALVHLNLSDCKNLVELPSYVYGLKSLEILNLSGCWKLKELPQMIGYMTSLKELLIDNTAIAVLPESIIKLTNLEKLNANSSKVKMLPTSIGNLCSLQELSLNHSPLVEVPNSVGRLKNLVFLSLVGCRSLSTIPDTIGTLKLLKKLSISVSGIQELPVSVGSLLYLKGLYVGECQSLCSLPDSIGALASLIELQLDRTSITNLPEQIGAMKMLRKFEMKNCKYLRALPESIGSMSALTTLDLFNANITELPDSFCMLENLIRLRLDGCKQLRKLPASIGNLKSLQEFLMGQTALMELPESFGMLSSLVVLTIGKGPSIDLAGNDIPNSVAMLTSFCNLTYLKELDARGWRISGRVPDEFERLSFLEILNLGHNSICSLPRSMKGLSVLKKLFLPDCKELLFLPPLPSSLIEVNVAKCSALERVDDISNLENLQELNLSNCEKVVDIPGLEHLKSLKRLYMTGCSACSHAVKRRFSKVLLKNIRILTMPGSQIPDWFSKETVGFSTVKNRKLEGIMVAGVFSLNHNIPNEFRGRMGGVEDVQAEILKLNDRVYNTTLRLLGIPMTNEEHFFLLRYAGYTPLVRQLQDGYALHVKKRNPPIDGGVELKKWGTHLIFEGDNHYDGDEESLDESQYSVSQRLAKFFQSS
ncbi:TIR-NBS-LRR disease resistance protein [Quillaja saponaria]|uniref:TIR-NBS-LRR disease resistance protein n=1 Tax=Quillaja saponaria TaxID=32244 RepID=A0AAD7KRD5_QUISA|nr:TIR-NBS-LRR disease resistance protein [Quillaja saponaria]